MAIPFVEFSSCQKLGISLENKVILNLYYQKMHFTKNVLLDSYSSMEKKDQKIPMILTYKTNFESQILAKAPMCARSLN